MKNKLRALGTLALFATLPVVTFAQVAIPPGQSAGQNTTVNDVLLKVQGWVNFIIPLVAALALLFFFWHLANYILKSGDEEKAKSKKGMINGIIALFLIASIWGIIALIGRSLGIGQGGDFTPGGVNNDGTVLPLN